MRHFPGSTVGRAVTRRLWLILLLTLGAGSAAFAAALLRAPVYEAAALVSIDESQNASQGFDAAMQADQFLTQRFILLGTSREVMQNVCTREGPGCDPSALGRQIRVTTLRATAQLQVQADAPSPAQAARLANEAADALIASNQRQVDQQVGAQRQYLQAELKQQGDQLTQLGQQVAASEAGGRPNSAGLSQLTLLQTQYSSTYQRLQDLDMQRAQRDQILSVEQRAVPPRTPVDPDPVRYVLVGVVGGLIAGLLAALLLEGTRTRIQSSSDLASAAGADIVIDSGRGLPIGLRRPYGFLARVAMSDPSETPPRVLLVGSTLGERVNEVAQELAGVVAASGRRVLVQLAPTPRGAGGRWRRRQAPEKLVVELRVPEGQAAPHPEADFDLVIHCSLPPTHDTSTTWLGPMPRRAVVVATRGRTSYEEVRRTAEMLGRVQVQVMAAVLIPPQTAVTTALARHLRWRRSPVASSTVDAGTAQPDPSVPATRAHGPEPPVETSALPAGDRSIAARASTGPR